MREVKWKFFVKDLGKTDLEIDECTENYAVTVRMTEDEALRLYEYLRGYFRKD